jgi:hypothetical protein
MARMAEQRFSSPQQQEQPFYNAPNVYSQLYEGPLAKSYMTEPVSPPGMFDNVRTELQKILFNADPRTKYTDKDYALPNNSGGNAASGGGGVAASQPMGPSLPSAPMQGGGAPAAVTENFQAPAPVAASAIPAGQEWAFNPDGTRKTAEQILAQNLATQVANPLFDPTHNNQNATWNGDPNQSRPMIVADTQGSSVPKTSNSTPMPNFTPPPTVNSASRTMYSINAEPNPKGVTRTKKLEV